MLVSRVQEVRFRDHHRSAVAPPPGAATFAAMTYPDGFAAVTSPDAPARSEVICPSRCQVVPSAEVSTTGPGPPTASQPAGPCVTLVSADRPGYPDATDSEETSVHDVPPGAWRHTAG